MMMDMMRRRRILIVMTKSDKNLEVNQSDSASKQKKHERERKEDIKDRIGDKSRQNIILHEQTFP